MNLMLIIGFASLIFGALVASAIWAVVVSAQKQAGQTRQRRRDEIMQEIGAMVAAVENLILSHDYENPQDPAFKHAVLMQMEQINKKFEPNLAQLDVFYVKYVEKMLLDFKKSIFREKSEAFSVEFEPEAFISPDLPPEPVNVRVPTKTDTPVVAVREETFDLPVKAPKTEEVRPPVRAAQTPASAPAKTEPAKPAILPPKPVVNEIPDEIEIFMPAAKPSPAVPPRAVIQEAPQKKTIPEPAAKQPPSPIDEQLGKEIESQFSTMVKAAEGTYLKKSAPVPEKTAPPVPAKKVKEPDTHFVPGETVLIHRSVLGLVPPKPVQEIPDEFELAPMPDPAEQVTQVILMDAQPAKITKPDDFLDISELPKKTAAVQKDKSRATLGITGDDVINKIDSFFGFNG